MYYNNRVESTIVKSIPEQTSMQESLTITIFHSYNISDYVNHYNMNKTSGNNINDGIRQLLSYPSSDNE